MARILVIALMSLLTAVGCDKQNTKAPEAPANAEAPAVKAETNNAQEAKPDPAAAAKPAVAEEAAATNNAAAEAAGNKDANPALLNPALANETAPATYKAKFVTSEGDFVVSVTREWSPNGADRFYNLVKIGFYDECRFFRVLDGFVAQWGINGNPEVMKAWREAKINDDPVKQSNVRGNLVFATAGPNTRTTQLFINFGNNVNLDGMGFSPFGNVSEGMDVVDKLYKGYGEGFPRGRGPDQGKLQDGGNTYLAEGFPKLSYIKSATIIE